MTGGGIYPAIAVLQALENNIEKILWIGSDSGMEKKLLRDYNLTLEVIPAAGLHGVNLLSIPANLIKLIKGWLVSRKILAEFKPDVIFYTGGYVGVPVAYANRKKIPSVVFIPDIEPGTALKQILPDASIITVCNNASLENSKFRNKTHVTGYPVRKNLLKWNRATGRKYFGIPPKGTVIFVFGGSKGSRSINQAILTHLELLIHDFYIIHISGENNWDEIKTFYDQLTPETKQRYFVYPFLQDEMGAALAAADLAICRAGASTLGELPAFSLPAILVPYPHAWRYQIQNAEYLEKNGAAIILFDNLLQTKLLKTIQEIMTDDNRLTMMKANMRKLSKPLAAKSISRLLVEAGNPAKQEERKNG